MDKIPQCLQDQFREETDIALVRQTNQADQSGALAARWQLGGVRTQTGASHRCGVTGVTDRILCAWSAVTPHFIRLCVTHILFVSLAMLVIHMHSNNPILNGR